MNKNPARRYALQVTACALLFAILHLLTATIIFAQPDPLALGVERLAKKAAALPHERRMSLVWTNHAALSEQRSERLRAAFVALFEAAQVKIMQAETAPALRVSIEQTPSQIVLTALVPGEGSTNVEIEEVARALVESDEIAGKSVRLEKQLVWHQETKVLSALLSESEQGDKSLVVLAEETFTIYRGGPGYWKAALKKDLPGPQQPQRSARGQLVMTDEKADSVRILLPGRRCEASLTDGSEIACAAVSVEWPAGRLMALPSCATHTWWLKSDGSDFVSEDRLLLQSTGTSKDAAAIAELGVAGPVISISAGPNPGSATVVVRNLATGHYEVYWVAVACGD